MGVAAVLNISDLYKKNSIQNNQPTWRNIRKVVFSDAYTKKKDKYHKKLVHEFL